MNGAFPSVNAVWEWPSANGFVAVVVLVIVLWACLLLEHLCYLDEDLKRWQSRYQALYVRIVFMFPCFAALAYIAACFPWLSHWTELAAVGLEAYVLLGFYALLMGLGHIFAPPGTFPDCLAADDAKWTNSAFRCCGGRFKDGQSVRRFFFWGIAQFSVVKPTILLVHAIVYWRGAELGQGLRVILNLATAVSTIWATVMVLRLYKGLQTISVMGGHRGLVKIAVVKLLFFFVVINNLVLRNLAEYNKLPIPPRSCPVEVRDANETYREYCEARVINLIFLLEVLICIIPAVLAYRHHGLGLDLETRHSVCRRATPHFLFIVFCCPLDLRLFWGNRLPVMPSNQILAVSKEVQQTTPQVISADLDVEDPRL